MMKRMIQKLLPVLALLCTMSVNLTVWAAPGMEEKDTLSENTALVSDNGGSALSLSESSATSENSALSENSAEDEQDAELKKILSGLSWNNWRIAYQEGVTEKKIPVAYINKTGAVMYGMIHIYFPADLSKAVPLVYIPHYEAGEYSLEAVNYLRHGWAVASPLEQFRDINSTLLEDDLVFNNAALYTLRHLPEIDPEKIALAGNSAGGYTALMLDALQLGNCACVANYAMVNPYDTFTQHFPEIDRWNRKYSVVTEEGKTEMLFPVGGQVTACFQGAAAFLPGAKEQRRWEELSPIGLCCDLSCPILENHYTSDLLIPVEEITRTYSYTTGGESMPADYRTGIHEKNPGVLGKAFTDLLPPQSVWIGHIRIETPYDEVTLPYNPQAFFNINILDDGPVESYSGHYAHADYVFKDDSVFLEDMFTRTLANTQILTADKTVLLLHRYMGDSPQLPVHVGINESVYGSITVYRNEIVEELAMYARDHSLAELEGIVMSAMQIYPEDPLLEQAWTEIRQVLMTTDLSR